MLQTCNSVVVMGLVLGQSLMVISSTGVPLIMQKYLGVLFTGKLHCLQAFYWSSMLGHQTLLVCKSSDLYILRVLRYWDSKRTTKIGEMDFLLSPMFMVQFTPNFG